MITRLKDQSFKSNLSFSLSLYLSLSVVMCFYLFISISFCLCVFLSYNLFLSLHWSYQTFIFLLLFDHFRGRIYLVFSLFLFSFYFQWAMLYFFTSYFGTFFSHLLHSTFLYIVFEQLAIMYRLIISHQFFSSHALYFLYMYFCGHISLLYHLSWALASKWCQMVSTSPVW